MREQIEGEEEMITPTCLFVEANNRFYLGQEQQKRKYKRHYEFMEWDELHQHCPYVVEQTVSRE